MRRVFYIVQKELRQIRRTPAYFGIIFIAPFLELIIMGSAITTDVKHVPLAVLDRDGGPASRRIREAAQAGASFDFIGMAESEDQARLLLDDGRAKLVIVVPPHFERDMGNGLSPQLQVLVDGMDGNSAGIALGYMQVMLAQVQSQWASRTAQGGASPPPSRSMARVELVPRMWYNPNIESRFNVVPGLLAILLMMVTAFLTSINIVREKEVGTFEQLMVAPVKGAELILGKTIPFAILGLMQFTIGIVAAGTVFGIWVKGGLGTLYAIAGLFCLSTLGVGIFVSTLANTQAQAMFITWFLAIYMLLLSGFFVPIENMPRAIQALTLINPVRYMISSMREVYLKGAGLRFLWQEALAMGGIGIVALVLASLRFQKRLK